MGVRLERPFTRMRYAEAMEAYGSDKPDTRYGLKLATVTQAVKDSSFRPASYLAPWSCILRCRACSLIVLAHILFSGLTVLRGGSIQ